MKKVKELLLILPVLVLMVAGATAYADGGSGGGGDNSGGSGSSSTSGGGDNSSSGGSTSTPGSTSGSSKTSEHSSTSTHGDTPKSTDGSGSDSHGGSDSKELEMEDSFRSQGQTLLAQAEKEHKSGRSPADLQKVCEARKKGIETRTAALVKNAQNSLSRINKVLTEVEAYQKTNNITVPNFDALVTATTTAQATATTSVQALAAVNPTIDCTSTSAASQLATFKAALTQSRTDLIAYRTAVQNVLTAVENANGTGSQQ